MKKNTWIALLVVIALAAIYYGTRQENKSVGIKKLTLPTFTKDKVDKIEILGKEKVLLEKKDNQWWVSLNIGDSTKKVLADNTNIDTLLDAALGVKPSYYVTELFEKLPELDLSDDKKTTVKIYSGNNILWSLDLGKNTNNSGRFIKHPDQKAVYAASGSFWQLTRNGAEDFSDKNLITVKEQDAREFKFFHDGGLKLSLIKADEKADWTFAPDQPNIEKDFRGKKSALLNLVKAATSLRASGFKGALELKNPNYEAIIKDKAGNINKVFFYNADEERYWAKKEGDSQVFEVSKYAFLRLNKPLEELRDLTFIKIENPNDVEKFFINASSGLIKFFKKDGHWTLESQKIKNDFVFDEETVSNRLQALPNLSAKRLAQKKDLALNPKWLDKFLLELELKGGQKIHLYVSEIKGDKDNYLVKGNIDDKIYIVPKYHIEPFLKGLDSFKKMESVDPKVDEQSPGFKNLPPDVQKKLMEMMKKSK